MNLSLIINTFNQPDYLARVLAAVARQSTHPTEVLLADDGSETPTRDLFSAWSARQKFPATHVWQPHADFRRTAILNQAVAAAKGDYLVFLDGDTLPHPEFIADHGAAAKSGFFVQGHRALVEQQAAAWFGTNSFAGDRRRAVWQNQISGIKNAFRWPMSLGKTRNDLHGIRGCNLAIWRDDLVRVNGYNEDFSGWGREDSELAARLFNSGVLRLDLRGRAVCFHLWHPPASRSNLPANDGLLEKTLREKIARCDHGLDKYSK